MTGSGIRREAAPGARSNRTIVTVALMLAMAVAALEQTVVSTAMPSIIAALKGIDIYPWVFSSYLLASTVSTPIYGKLADLFGRKRLLLFGIGMFMLGSVLSGLAQSMPQLIATRIIQGLGAGALSPIVLTMIGDLFTLQERARVQGVFSLVWGGSSLLGPALGGVLTDQLSWRWVFFVTVPFGLVSCWILVRHVHEHVERHDVKPIDWTGASLLAAGSTVLLLAVLKGQGLPSILTGVLLALAVGLMAAFVRQERQAPDPVLPIDLLASPHFAAAIFGSFLVGALLFGIDTFIPLYIQGVRSGTATQAGRALTPLFFTWSISVMVAAAVVVRLGFRRTAVYGSILITEGVLALVLGTIWPESFRSFFLVGMIVIGLGMGPTSLSYILAVQNSVDWGRRGAATGAVIFSRTMGGALGVGILGATLGVALAHRLAALGGTGIDVTAALRPETHKLLNVDQLRLVQESLGRSLRDVFLLMLATAALAIVCSIGLRGGRARSFGETIDEPTAVDESASLALVEHG